MDKIVWMSPDFYYFQWDNDALSITISNRGEILDTIFYIAKPFDTIDEFKTICQQWLNKEYEEGE